MSPWWSESPSTEVALVVNLGSSDSQCFDWDRNYWRFLGIWIYQTARSCSCFIWCEMINSAIRARWLLNCAMRLLSCHLRLSNYWKYFKFHTPHVLIQYYNSWKFPVSHSSNLLFCFAFKMNRAFLLFYLGFHLLISKFIFYASRCLSYY